MVLLGKKRVQLSGLQNFPSLHHATKPLVERLERNGRIHSAMDIPWRAHASQARERL